MKKITLLLVGLVIMGGLAKAQFDYTFPGRSEDLKMMGKRKLAVEILQEDNRTVAKLTREMKDHPNALFQYRAFLKSYNENLKNALDKYWTLSDSIVYVKSTDLQRLKDGRDKKNYMVLTAEEQGSGNTYITRAAGSAVVLVLYPLDKGTEAANYRIPLPFSFARNDGANTPGDFNFVVRTAVANIEYMVDKKTTSDFVDFMEGQAVANCKKIEEKTLLADKDLVDSKADKEDIKKRYNHKVKLANNTEVEEAITNGSDAECYTVLIPMSVYRSPSAIEGGENVICYLVIANTSDQKILNFAKGKAKAGTSASLIHEKDFTKLGSCEKD